MSSITFKCEGKPNDLINYRRGWFALGGRFVHDDGTHLLSAECVGVWEAEENAQRLHKEIDRALAQAKRCFKDVRSS